MRINSILLFMLLVFIGLSCSCSWDLAERDWDASGGNITVIDCDPGSHLIQINFMDLGSNYIEVGMIIESLDSLQVNEVVLGPTENSSNFSYAVQKSSHELCVPYQVRGVAYEEDGTQFISEPSCVFNPDPSETWEQLTNLPTAGLANAVATYTDNISEGSRIFVGTGRESTDTTIIYTRKMWAYNLRTAQWSNVPDFPGQARESGVAFVAGGMLYVGLGVTGTNFHRDFFAYSLSANGTWEAGPDFPATGRSNPVTFTLNNSVYVGLGFDGSTNTADFYTFNPTGQWVAAPTFPGSARSAAFSFVIGNRAFVGGGSLGEQDFYSLDTFGNWTELNSLPFSQTAGLSSFTIDEIAYVVNGFSANSLIWKYDLETDTWTEATIPFPSRYSSVAAASKCEAVIIGGLNEDELLFNEVWQFSP